MKLYHGTNRDFDRIDLLKSKPNKDFGRGFYLSADYGQALDMAQVKVLFKIFPHGLVLFIINMFVGDFFEWMPQSCYLRVRRVKKENSVWSGFIR